MTLKAGFFNSIGSDRTYSAEDFSEYLKGIITNGFLPNDSGFLAEANPAPIGTDPPSVIIKAGKAYLDGLWLVNDADLIYSMGIGQQITPGMYHLVYLCFDTNDAVRDITIECLTGTDPILPSDGSGKYYLPIAKVTDAQNVQPSVITDLRPYAGVSGTGITNPSLVDDCVDERVLGTGAVHTHHVEDLALSTAKYANASVTLPKLSTGLFIPKVEAMSSFTVGDWVAGATTPGYTPTVNAVAIVTAGFYDLEALYPGRFHATLQYKIGNGAWTGMNPAVVSDVSGSDLGVQFTYPIYITAGQTIYFRALGQAAVTAQWSTSSYIFGFLLPR